MPEWRYSLLYLHDTVYKNIYFQNNASGEKTNFQMDLFLKSIPEDEDS